MTDRRSLQADAARSSRAFQFVPGHVGGRVASAQPVRRRRTVGGLSAVPGTPPATLKMQNGSGATIAAPPADVSAAFHAVITSGGTGITPPAGWTTLASGTFAYGHYCIMRRVGTWTESQTVGVGGSTQVGYASAWFTGATGGSWVHSLATPSGITYMDLVDAPAGATCWARLGVIQNLYSGLSYDSTLGDTGSSSFTAGYVSPRGGTYTVASDPKVTLEESDYSVYYVDWTSIGAWGTGDGLCISAGWAP